MGECDADRFAAVVAAETALLSSEVRRDPARVSALLADDFVEIGRSGRRFTAADIVAALTDEPERPEPRTSEWRFTEVAEGLVLVTYVIEGERGRSRHSSLWRTDGPRLVFHQGTVVAD